VVLPKIKEIKSILVFAKKAFTKGGFRLADQYINGLISLENKTVNNIAKASNDIEYQSQLNYLLTEAKFEQEVLTKRYLKKLKYLFKNVPVFLIIDDTLVERNGDTVQEAQYHYDHNTGKQIKGHQFFTALFWTPILQMPIFPELYSKNTDSKIKMAQSLIDKVELSKIKINTVLFDSWYSEEILIKKCIKAKARVICSIKTNRKIKIGKERKWRKLSFVSERIHSQKMDRKNIENKTYGVYSSIVSLNHLPSIKLVISEQISEDDELVGKAHLISTNIKDNAEEIIRVYKLRWKIETYHRDIKQNLGFATVFFARREGIIRHAILASITYAVLSLFMFRMEKSMTIGECCAYLKEKSTISLVEEIVVIESKPKRLERFEEVFKSKSQKL
jgi:hypothetical protein